jgi:hypothetical protein
LSALTISAPERSPAWRLLAALLMLSLLVACGPNKVIVEGNFPPPLMNKVPLRLGVWYGEDFANHEFFDEARGRAESAWLVQTGQAQVALWDTLLTGMFTELVHMKNEPGTGQMNQLVDAILIPKVEELQYTIPAHTNVKVYEIWMRYRFQLVTNDGEPIAEWTMTSYGKTPTAFLRSDEAAVNMAAVVALRDAGANFATNFTRVPEVNAWLEVRGDTPLLVNPGVQIVPVAAGESVEEAIEEAIEEAEEVAEQAEEAAP